MIVAIYTRFSPGNDPEKTSTIEAQIQMCRDLADTNGWYVDDNHTYLDRSKTGATIHRPAFQQMLSNMESGYFPNVLITKDTSRLFRNEQEAGHYESWIWSQGIEIRYVIGQSGNPNENDDMWFSGRIGHLVAEFYRRKTAKITFAHQQMNAKSGHFNGGAPPFGYLRKEVYIEDEVGVKKRKVTLQIDPATAPAVKYAFEMLLAGQGGKQISDELTAKGYLSRRGKPIPKPSILVWFRLPFVYVGYRVWNVAHWKRNKEGKKINRIFHPREEWVMVPDSHPAIITEQEAETVYHKMQQTPKPNRMGQTAKYLLTGLLKCKQCGSNLQMKFNVSWDLGYYCCGSRRLSRANCDNARHFHQRVLENLVMQTVQECILDGGYLERHFERLQQQMERDRDNHKVQQLSQQQVELEGRIDTALEMLMDRRIPQQERIISKLQQDEQRLEQVSNELKVLQDTTVPTQKQIQNFWDQIVGELKQGGEKVKTVLHKLLRKVEVEQDGFLEFDFIVVLGNTPYTSYLLRGFQR
ncbi:hypothetical protein CMK12_05510 [Candidatus Poribacteria bacterium]|jgi:DNA invertase Pin-like site-specific DNA recombinase|nr:hypothetical protein [Candidatus Poribacteria bacterium]MDP6998924.1 recombinase family protein [Candidatus Poribacteria bacterium]